MNHDVETMQLPVAGIRQVTGLLVLLFLALVPSARASDVCAFSQDDLRKRALGVSIAKVACEEYVLWRKPFINAQGRMVRIGPMEGERDSLADGETAAWRRVLWYWRESGLLADNAEWERSQIAQRGDRGRNGASHCLVDPQDWAGRAGCRAFLIDVPWSAVFVSYTMRRADVAGFVTSSAHYYYMRDAAHHPDASGPYRLADPSKEKPEIGDLICYVRERDRLYGYAGLAKHLHNDGRKLDTHCDIVVAANLDGDSKLYAIGGNVIHGVTMRKLNLNAEGVLSLPKKKHGSAARMFDPRDESTENLNRQDWAALLKLDPGHTPK